jgi:catechol 2,3-dioxygenase-like lactoylglutathione lyase family enzyme
MFAKIRHVAIFTDNYSGMVNFYQTLFGMKRVTSGSLDEAGNPSADRGHVSDGVIGLAVLVRRAGIPGTIDHFGFEVEDVREVLRRFEKYYPDTLVTRSLDHVPFAGLRSHDPAGSQFDLAQKGVDNIREGYIDEGWDQPRQFNHIALRAAKPARIAEFYQKVFELKETGEPTEEGGISLTDGKVRLLIRPCNDRLYRGMRQGIDHIGFRVESVEQVKKEIAELSRSAPQSVPMKLAVGMHGERLEKDLKQCRLGQYLLSDPEGSLLDLSEG